MIKIRKNVFETNSSSTHVLSIEGFKGISPFINKKRDPYFIKDGLVDTNEIDLRGSPLYHQGINPIYSDPDVDDVKYEKALSKAKLIWTYLMQNLITDERLVIFLNVMHRLMVTVRKEEESRYKDQKLKFTSIGYVFWTSTRYMEELRQLSNLFTGSDNCIHYDYAGITSQFCPLSEYEERCSTIVETYYSDRLSQYYPDECEVNWSKRRKNHKYTDINDVDREWGIYADHSLVTPGSWGSELFDALLTDPKTLKAVLINEECVIHGKRVG